MFRNVVAIASQTQTAPSSPSYLMVPVGEGSGLMRWAMLSGMLMVSGEIWGWMGLTGDSGTFLGSFLSLDRAVNVIFILVLGKRKQHLRDDTDPSGETTPRGRVTMSACGRAPLPGNKHAEALQMKTGEEHRDFTTI